MTRLDGTCVEIPVILREEVHIVEDVAHVVVLLDGLGGPHVHEHGSVEGLVAGLLYDVDPVLDLLSLKETVDVEKKSSEVRLSVSVRHDDGNFMLGLAVLRFPSSTQLQHREHLRHVVHAGDVVDNHRKPAVEVRRDHWTQSGVQFLRSRSRRLLGSPSPSFEGSSGGVLPDDGGWEDSGEEKVRVEHVEEVSVVAKLVPRLHQLENHRHFLVCVLR